jgi:Ni,Fe-hydrogenase III small subunit
VSSGEGNATDIDISDQIADQYDDEQYCLEFRNSNPAHDTARETIAAD